MKSAVATNQMEDDLETLRKQMVEAAKEHGMQHPLVLYYSREVDRVHTELQTTRYTSKCG
ncbi:aspartyl-phosphate phosphatase Spo0E family protein [Salicibibacter halophilus]|uniref:Aspartyl-phosphate phosphatase Spo0E family protein n=1 Tax=Salicibibacter halophilus TaxID=2502791 RepID=A0A514LHI5_9BACI|nr:aspartyl-phosphate phosphatase Spo0E family protein [Salicibibacter halophilus]QDI91299.1 aspartyl-phosphate phosphatase Spo0E family protein [Salicibibacter halophilus]